MSDLLGRETLVSFETPQQLTGSYAAMGDQYSFGEANQAWIRLYYEAGTETTGLDIAVKFFEVMDGEDAYMDPVLTDIGDVLEASERIVLVPKEKEGFWDIPIVPNGRRYFQIYIKAEGTLGATPGTVYADLELYRTQVDHRVISSTGPRYFTVPAITPTATLSKAVIYGKDVDGVTEIVAKTVNGETLLSQTEYTWTHTITAEQIRNLTNENVVLDTIPLDTNEYLIPTLFVADYQPGTEAFELKTLPDDADYTAISVLDAASPPTGPSSGDSYFAGRSQTPSGWTADYYYEWDGDEWVETETSAGEVGWLTGTSAGVKLGDDGWQSFEGWSWGDGFYFCDATGSVGTMLVFYAIDGFWEREYNNNARDIRVYGGDGGGNQAPFYPSATGQITVRWYGSDSSGMKSGVGNGVVKLKLWYTKKTIPDL